MKPLLTLTILASALITASAQEAKKMEVVIERKETPTAVTPGQGGKKTEIELKKRLEFDHFFANLGKTNNAIKVFDLTQPIDEKKAKEQVTEEEPSRRINRHVRGIKLLSIRF